MVQREIRDGVPLASRSKTLKEIGGVSKLKLLKRGDRAFIVAKINSELGNPRRAGCAARIALDYEAGKENFYAAARKAKAMGLEEKAREFARKHVKYCINYENFVGAVQTALEFSVKESAVRAAATIAERFILDGDFQSAEELVAMFGISSNLEEFSKAHVETLISEKQHMAATRFAKHLALKEMARKAIMAQIETEDSPPSKNILAAAREFGASEDEIFSAIEKSLEGILAKGDSPSGFLYFLEDLGDSPLPKENARRIAMVCIRKLAEREDYVEALVTARKYGIPKGDVRGIAIQAIASGMGAEEEEVAKISEDFGVGKEELATIAEEAMLNRIREGRYDYATKIALAYPVSEANANFLKGVLSALPK